MELVDIIKFVVAIIFFIPMSAISIGGSYWIVKEIIKSSNRD